MTNDPRIETILQLIAQLASGNLDAKETQISSYGDEFDAVVDGMNMLANELKKDRDGLNEAHQKLQRLNQSKNEILAIVSHEFRTPLTSVIGYAEVLLDCKVSEDQKKEFLQNIISEAEFLGTLTDNILDTSSMEAGILKFNFSHVLLEDVFKKTEQVINGYLKKRETIQIEFPYMDREVQFVADRDRIVQVLVNLLSNAIKFSPNSGKIKIDLRLNPNNFALSIADEGPGIPEESLDKVFDPYHQTERTQSVIKGSGLGLTIAKGIIEGHQGKIWANNLKQGAMFSFTLPYQQISLQ